MVLKDGDVVTLGKTSVKIYVTPGHTPGALSMIFPVFDHGQRHLAGLMGGTGGGQDTVSAHKQIVRWRAGSRSPGRPGSMCWSPTIRCIWLPPRRKR
jgi:metallo-beta-lactamase class B